MFKCLSIFAALVVLSTGSANAQQREATFQKIVVPGSSFDIVVATPKLGSPTVNYAKEIDPNVFYLGNGLVTAYTTELAKMLDLATLMRPAHMTIVGTPVVIYVVPKRTGSDATAMR
ncbi:MAG TPA: hypothetical protein VMH84_06805 [Xanthobacteraceae bacterium]|nr:hypothetical protein [Xanthobacteraceae bacterium]